MPSWRNWLAQRTFNPWVLGSSPRGGTTGPTPHRACRCGYGSHTAMRLRHMVPKKARPGRRHRVAIGAPGPDDMQRPDPFVFVPGRGPATTQEPSVNRFASSPGSGNLAEPAPERATSPAAAQKLPCFSRLASQRRAATELRTSPLPTASRISWSADSLEVRRQVGFCAR